MAAFWLGKVASRLGRHLYQQVYVNSNIMITKQTFKNITNSLSIKTFYSSRGFRITVDTFRQLCLEKQTVPGNKRGPGLALFPLVLGLGLFSFKSEEQKEYDAAVEKLKKDDRVVLLLKHAKLAEHKRDYADADKFYHEALSVVQMYEKLKTWTPNEILDARVYIYDHLANLAMARQRFEQAETLFKETMRGLLQRGREKNDDAIIEISLKLAMLYAIQKRPEEAEKGYLYCIELQEKKLSSSVKGSTGNDNTVALLGMCLDSYARFLLVQEKYPQAQTNWEKALKLAREVYGSNHPQVAVLLNNLATAASIQKDDDLAKKHLEAAIDVAKATDMQDLATYQLNLGLVYLKNKELAEARKYCEMARKTARKGKDKNIEDKADFFLDAIKNNKT